jgi:hypothetical protein
MITQPLLRTFSKYACMNIVGMVSISCYILADTFLKAYALGVQWGLRPSICPYQSTVSSMV